MESTTFRGTPELIGENKYRVQVKPGSAVTTTFAEAFLGAIDLKGEISFEFCGVETTIDRTSNLQEKETDWRRQREAASQSAA